MKKIFCIIISVLMILSCCFFCVSCNSKGQNQENNINNESGNESGNEGGIEGGSESGNEGGTEGGSESGSEGGTEGGSGSGSEGGTEGGSGSGSEGGTEGGSESGNEGGTEGGSESGNEGNTDAETTYTITFDSYGGTEVASISAKYGEEVTLPTPTRDDYTFVKWVIKGTSTVVTSGAWQYKQNVELKAVWKSDFTKFY